ncbi:MAG: 3-oxoacyl-ACP reductase FabG [Chloroflexi bacterium]|nr:3-oxoacyl-ACP reductase FabG [Chloroflexota bacterium]
MYESIKGRVVIVTGGGQGIGRAYVLGLAGAGAKVVVAEIRPDTAEAVVAEVRSSGGDAIAVQTDVTSFSSTQNMAEATVNAYGRIDAIVNNAAIYYGLRKTPFTQLDEGEWDRVMAVNVKGIWNCARAVLPQMQQQGRGKIINIASTVAIAGVPLMLHYNASKGAVIALTRAMAKEMPILGSAEITVNCICPGLTWSEATQLQISGHEDKAALVVQQQALKRREQPEDLVGPMMFLVSDESNFISGHSLVVDGGFTVY